MVIYHIVTPAEWQRWADSPVYEAVSLHTEGFIHCSMAMQIPPVLDRYYTNVSELLLLHLDTEQLGDKLVFEPSTNEEIYPHLYAPIDKKAIVEITALKSNNLIVNLPN